ncbi:MAG TPA: TetR/AcrR family transcriptional regulator [Smithella sp.]|nr:TetR/AcrR family transcriptional regulator [Smithella sp.]MDM7988735.1 TetR/AcrR family transcriptional regulator [Smithella sp.]HNY49319.1 TetR/AcrR family transcriptional regulator [Smithella sp.]HOG89934.1 TetR/AcrR family transcriptional regulator [Smithella sp.]HQG66296.1 TetR/AcrR family transcriptional regulator [Smithella sp.]
MPKTTRSLGEIDAVRERILDCAIKILEKNGFESLSMAKLGSKMNMTAANLYNYYTNKDELLIAIHKKTYSMLYDEIRNSVKKSDTPLQRVRNIVNSFVQFGTRNINIYDVMFNRPVKQHSDYVGTPLEKISDDEFHNSLKVLTFALKVIKDYRKTKPNLKPVDEELLAVQIISALHGVISLHNSGVLYQVAGDTETVLKKIVDDIIRSITK